MNKKRIFNMLLAATLTAGAVSLQAAEQPEIKVDFDNGIITISG